MCIASSSEGCSRRPDQGPERTLLLVNRGFLLSQRERRRDDEADAGVREAVVAAQSLDDADLLSAAFDLQATHEENGGRYGEAYRTDLERSRLIARMTDVKEIGDAYAVAARAAQHLGRFAEAETHATACIERARGIDSGSYLHGLTWRVAARFALGDWDGALVDQKELERVAAVGPQALPPAFTMGAYTRVALCHELRGERDDADRYIDMALRYIERIRHAYSSSWIHLPPFALVLSRHGRFDEALALIPLVPEKCERRRGAQGPFCEITAARERWDEAGRLVQARAGRPRSENNSRLPLFADRLEGRAASAAGDLAKGAELLAGAPKGSRRSGPAGRRRGHASRWPRWSWAATRNTQSADSPPRCPSSRSSARYGRRSGRLGVTREGRGGDGLRLTSWTWWSLCLSRRTSGRRSDGGRAAPTSAIVPRSEACRSPSVASLDRPGRSSTARA